jgi:sulfur-oxidizing protein SoxY
MMGLERRNTMSLQISRRDALGLSIGALAAGAGLGAWPSSAYAAKNDAEELMRKFAGGKEPVKGKVKLDLPQIAENGNTVPMTVSVESPMTAQSYVSEVMVIADANPRAGIITFRFSPESGAAEANTRIRLAETQNVIALAKMNDGSVYMTSQEVKVTIGGCGG